MAARSAVVMSLKRVGQRLLTGQGAAGMRQAMGAASGMGAWRQTSRRGYAAAPSSEPLKVQVQTPYKGYKIDPPSTEVQTSAEELVKFYEEMYRMRRMELAFDNLYKGKLVRGFCHLYDGQEAVCVGLEAAITPEDTIITSYRDHCIQIGRGGRVQDVMGEMLGRKDGCSKGKGGSMHMYRRETNFYGGQGIVGAQTPIGAGLGFALKYLNKPAVSITMYGDGAANQGQFFESLNMAALWKLPVLYLCENNHYGLGTADRRAAKSIDFYTRGDYVPGLWVDGMDVLAVKKAIAFAKEHVLSTSAPMIVEVDTYRYHGHSMSDPGSTYRTREEITGIRQTRDPIERVKKLLLGNDLISKEDLKAVEKTVTKEVNEAVEFAKNNAEPDGRELYRDVYINGTGIKLYGVDRKVTALEADAV
ncbi:hypothetical protein CBR_g49974 [Chara braunii]|uniref:Pyruvate dehydrogenase E1 component subunit alpha n=1 Tax=Chara braunii TaxID=69332 RepID=A0A388K546_CHABU|nr:hypothetical protein CBR_g49974 [Chara braunii]|eukprot:GBG65180.1 hypothetical protein CBR_g49974 [Chara braunii]